MWDEIGLMVEIGCVVCLWLCMVSCLHVFRYFSFQREGLDLTALHPLEFHSVPPIYNCNLMFEKHYHLISF